MQAKLSLAGALLGLLCLVPASAIHAAEGFGVPISDRVIVGTVDIKGTSVTFAVREGTLLTLEDTDTDTMVGLSPAITDESAGAIAWLPLKIVTTTGGRQELQFIPLKNDEELRVDVGRPTSLPLPDTAWLGPFEVASISPPWRGFPTLPSPGNALESEPSALRAQFGRSSGNSCCVSCGTISVCGTSVRIASCGVCQDAGGVPLPDRQQ